MSLPDPGKDIGPDQQETCSTVTMLASQMGNPGKPAQHEMVVLARGHVCAHCIVIAACLQSCKFQLPANAQECTFDWQHVDMQSGLTPAYHSCERLCHKTGLRQPLGEEELI